MASRKSKGLGPISGLHELIQPPSDWAPPSQPTTELKIGSFTVSVQDPRLGYLLDTVLVACGSATLPGSQQPISLEQLHLQVDTLGSKAASETMLLLKLALVAMEKESVRGEIAWLCAAAAKRVGAKRPAEVASMMASRYGAEGVVKTYAEVGKSFGLTRAGVNQHAAKVRLALSAQVYAPALERLMERIRQSAGLHVRAVEAMNVELLGSSQGLHGALLFAQELLGWNVPVALLEGPVNSSGLIAIGEERQPTLVIDRNTINKHVRDERRRAGVIYAPLIRDSVSSVLGRHISLASVISAIEADESLIPLPGHAFWFSWNSLQSPAVTSLKRLLIVANGEPMSWYAVANGVRIYLDSICAGLPGPPIGVLISLSQMVLPLVGGEIAPHGVVLANPTEGSPSKHLGALRDVYTFLTKHGGTVREEELQSVDWPGGDRVWAIDRLRAADFVEEISGVGFKLRGRAMREPAAGLPVEPPTLVSGNRVVVSLRQSAARRVPMVNRIVYLPASLTGALQGELHHIDGALPTLVVKGNQVKRLAPSVTALGVSDGSHFKFSVDLIKRTYSISLLP